MMKKELQGIEDLKPAECNPRAISAEALAGLRHSLNRFGDISGFVWNQRSGRLVTGHQRLDALKKQYGDTLKIEDGKIIAGDKTFPVRIVNWDKQTEQAANIAANSQYISGEYTRELESVLDEIKGEIGDFDDLRFDILALSVKTETIDDKVDFGDHIKGYDDTVRIVVYTLASAAGDICKELKQLQEKFPGMIFKTMDGI